MYLTHHYLIDVVGGSCLATVFFYLFLPDELKGDGATTPPVAAYGKGRSKYEIYDIENPRVRSVLDAEAFDLSEPSSDEEVDITYRSPLPSATPAGSFGHSQKAVNGGPHVGRKTHRHTASIASLIRGEERSAEDGWSPVATAFPNPSGRGGGAAADRGRDYHR